MPESAGILRQIRLALRIDCGSLKSTFVHEVLHDLVELKREAEVDSLEIRLSKRTLDHAHREQTQDIPLTYIEPFKILRNLRVYAD